MFGDSLREIALCPVKPSTNEYKAKIEELLDNTRAEFLRKVEEALERCRKWTLKVRRRFMERVERLKAVDAGLADTIKLKLEECFENINHRESPGGSSMVR
jgi:hypothetical protein